MDECQGGSNTHIVYYTRIIYGIRRFWEIASIKYWAFLNLCNTVWLILYAVQCIVYTVYYTLMDIKR